MTELASNLTFRFRAIDGRGVEVTGIISATAADEAVSQLRERGLIPLSMRTSSWWMRWRPSESRGRLRRRSVRKLLRTLSSLCSAKVPLDDAVALVTTNWADAHERQLLEGLQSRLRAGIPLATALGDHVPPQIAHIVLAGELSGRLTEALDRAASLMEDEAERTSRTLEAASYPAILVVAACATLTILFAVVVPNIAPLVADRRDRLPAFTRVVFDAGQLLQDNFSTVAVLLMVLLLASLCAARSKAFSSRCNRFVLRLPHLSRLIRMGAEAAFLNTLAHLTHGSIPLLKAVELAIGTITNDHLRREYDRIIVQLRAGGRLSDALAATLFSADAVLLARLGETSGTLAESLERAALLAQKAIDARVKNGLALLGPLLTVLIGLVAGLVVAAIFSAVMAVNQLGS